jgi:hypothetical protein
MKMATWKVRGISTKDIEEKKINAAVITERKKETKGTQNIGNFIK